MKKRRRRVKGIAGFVKSSGFHSIIRQKERIMVLIFGGFFRKNNLYKEMSFGV